MARTHTYTVKKRVIDLTPEEYKAVYRLNMGSGGCMQSQLAHEKYKRSNAYAVMKFDRESKKLIGWALLFPNPSQWANKKHTAYFYVRKAHRRKGVASSLMNNVRKIDPEPAVQGWNRSSDSFFMKTLGRKY